jgi:hypothetical protein
MDATMYRLKKVESSRTHDGTIDVELFDGDGKVRAFIDDEMAMELVTKIIKALATPYVEPIDLLDKEDNEKV